MSLNYSPKIVSNGLVLCLDAGDTRSYPGSGTTWTDRSGNGNNGTLVNGVGYNSANRGSLVFDGVNDRTTFVGNNINGLAELTNEFTISTWVRYNSLAAYSAFLTKQNSAINSTGTPRLDLGAVGTSLYTTTYNSSTGAIEEGVFTASLLPQVWYNIALVCGVSLKRVYINGVQRYSSSFTSSFPANTQTLGIPNQRPLNGNMAIMNIYNRSLSVNEIRQNFEATRTRFGV